MKKCSLIFRKMAVVAAVFISVTMLLGCKKTTDQEDSKDPNNPHTEVESWIEFAGEKYYYFYIRQITYGKLESGDEFDFDYPYPHLWGIAFRVGTRNESNTRVGFADIQLGGFRTETSSPNGSYRIISSYDDMDETYNFCGFNNHLHEEYTFGDNETILNYTITGGTLNVSKNGNIWTIKLENSVAKNKENGATKPISINYRGEMTPDPYSDPIP